MIHIKVLFLFSFIPCILSAVPNEKRLKYNCNNVESDCATKEYDVDMELCGSKKCIFKCCPNAEVLVLGEGCVPGQAGDFSNLTVYDYYLNPMNKKFYDIFHVIPNKLGVPEYANNTYYPAEVMDRDMYLEQSGVLYIEEPNHYHRWIKIPDICIDYESNEDQISPEPKYWINYVNNEHRNEPTDMLVIALSTSSFFMILIILIYHWIFYFKMTLVIKIRLCLLYSYVCYFIILVCAMKAQHSETSCVILTFIGYFSIMSTCCWLNVMSYDTWLTFRDLLSRNLTPSEKRRRDCYKFKRYVIYGWGLPFCMACALLIINSIDMSSLPWFVTPQIPGWGCYLIGGQELVYQYIPMLILIIVNCVLFILTAINISCMVNGTQALGPNNRQRQKARLKICLRLSVTMGISWVWDVISFLVPEADAFADYLDLYNGFIGLLIFAIFICNKHTLSLIKHSFNRLLGREDPAVINSNSDSRLVPMKTMNNNSDRF